MVTLGSQHTRNVVVLPNMRGIIATFDSVDTPPEGFGSNGYADRNIRVWTSEGQVYAGDARIYPAQGPKKIGLEIKGGRLLKDGLLRVAVTRATIKNWNTNIKLGDSVEIQMPKRWLAAYPGFKLDGSKVTGKVIDPANQTTRTVKLDALTWKDATAGVVKGTLASDTAEALHTLRCTQPVKVGWTLVTAGSAALVFDGSGAPAARQGADEAGRELPLARCWIKTSSARRMDPH